MYKKGGTLLSDIITNQEEEGFYFEFENIQLSDHFGRSEKQILEMSIEYRNACLSRLSTKSKTERIQREREEQMQKAKQKSDELANKYKR